MLRISALALWCACAVGVSACGGSDTEPVEIDTGEIETKVSDGYFEQTGQRVKSMTCPDELESVKGATASCKLTTFEGNSGDIKVVVLDTEGNIRWDVVEPERTP